MVHRLSLLTPFAHRLVLCLGVVTLAGCAPPETARAAPGGAPAIPRVALGTPEGGTTDLPGYLHGRSALVSFWATWCDACVEEMPALNRLAAEVAPRSDTLVLGVAIGEARDTVIAFARSHRLAYAQLVDEDFRFADAIGERRVPTTIVVDHEGRIVYRGGALDEAGLSAFRRVAKF